MHPEVLVNFLNPAQNGVYIKEEIIIPDDLSTIQSIDNNDNITYEPSEIKLFIKNEEKFTNPPQEKQKKIPTWQPVWLYCSNCHTRTKKKFRESLKACEVCHEAFKYECQFCNRQYKDVCKATQHVRFDCNKEPAFRCDKCDFKTTRPAYLKNHMDRKHTKVDPNNYYECSKCEKKYKREKIMKNHEKNCGLYPYIKCEYCNYRTHNTRNIRFHMISKHIGMKTNYSCPKCPKTFKWQLHLVHHMDIMHSEKRKVVLSCAHCRNYKTFVKSRLIKHIFKNHEI